MVFFFKIPGFVAKGSIQFGKFFSDLLLVIPIQPIHVFIQNQMLASLMVWKILSAHKGTDYCFVCAWQHFHQLAKENQLSNDLRLDGGNDDTIGGVAAATENMMLTGGETQTLSFDD